MNPFFCFPKTIALNSALLGISATLLAFRINLIGFSSATLIISALRQVILKAINVFILSCSSGESRIDNKSHFEILSIFHF
jgi:hypothetical protein